MWNPERNKKSPTSDYIQIASNEEPKHRGICRRWSKLQLEPLEHRISHKQDRVYLMQKMLRVKTLIEWKDWKRRDLVREGKSHDKIPIQS